jgi:bifunctional DNA-binding transcriptional regulator/antitoxin component of YhaV-PrlF toxin-antitoxin module
MTEVKIGKVTRLGTGLAIVIPVEILRGLNIKRGDMVAFAVYDKDIFYVRHIPQKEMAALKPKEK